MFRCLLIILFFSWFMGVGYAQQVIKAAVFENKTRIALTGVRVRNLNNKQSTMTDKAGKFSISAKLNDLLVLTIFSYENDTVVVTSLKEREIFMEPTGTLLQEVKVSTPQTNLGTLTVPELHNQKVAYAKDANGSYKGGVVFNIFSNNSEEKKRQRLEQIDHEEQVRRDIEKVFSPQNLAKYLPLKPEELAGFKTRYTPSIPVYTSKNFSLLFYVDSCYKVFQKLTPAQKLVQPLRLQ